MSKLTHNEAMYKGSIDHIKSEIENLEYLERMFIRYRYSANEDLWKSMRDSTREHLKELFKYHKERFEERLTITKVKRGEYYEVSS